MSSLLIVMVLLALVAVAFQSGRARALAVVDGRPALLHSVPSYYGAWVALWCGLPAAALLAAWVGLETRIVDAFVFSGLPAEQVAQMSASEKSLFLSSAHNVASGGFSSDDPQILAAAADITRLSEIVFAAVAVLALVLALGGLLLARGRIAPELRARNRVERALRVFMVICSTLAILTTIGIVVSLFYESLRFFARYPVFDFLFGLQWSPQTAIREDQVGSSGAFGAIPVFAGTLLISAIALVVAVPIGLLTAIYLADYAPQMARSVLKPVIEVLAGVPTVVYGFFAVLTVAPALRQIGLEIGLNVDANSALAAGLVMGIMIIPFVSSLSDDVINAVPQALRDGSAALGATASETVRQVVLPAALPGIVGAILLAASRAIGETMIVVMAAGLAANLTANPLEAVTTVTVQIVTNLTGDQEFDSAKTLSAFALGLVLFAITLFLNVIALRIVQKYREKYD